MGNWGWHHRIIAIRISPTAAKILKYPANKDHKMKKCAEGFRTFQMASKLSERFLSTSYCCSQLKIECSPYETKIKMLISVDGFFLLYICITFFILRTSSKQKLTKGLKENWQIKLGPGGAVVVVWWWTNFTAQLTRCVLRQNFLITREMYRNKWTISGLWTNNGLMVQESSEDTR